MKISINKRDDIESSFIHIQMSIEFFYKWDLNTISVYSSEQRKVNQKNHIKLTYFSTEHLHSERIKSPILWCEYYC